MPEGLEKIRIIAGLIFIIFIGFVLYCLSPFLSEMSGSEITSPIFSYKEGVLLIIMAVIAVVAILFFVKK